MNRTDIHNEFNAKVIAELGPGFLSLAGWTPRTIPSAMGWCEGEREGGEDYGRASRFLMSVGRVGNIEAGGA
jgi:hypothetical protein